MTVNSYDGATATFDTFCIVSTILVFNRITGLLHATNDTN